MTGAGSGIGLSASKALARDGWTVYDFSRTDRAAPNVKHIGCDISDEAQVRAAVARVIEEQGRIDLLLNNAGFGISGAVEFTRAEEAEKLIRVNLLGADNVTRAVLGAMRAQRADSVYQLYRRNPADSVSDVVFGYQGGDQRVCAGASKRGRAVRRFRVRGHAGRYSHRLHGGAGEVGRGRRRIRRPD